MSTPVGTFTMKTKLSISYPRSYKHYTGTYLVRGLTRRSIRVIVRPFYGLSTDGDVLALLAAEVAVKSGWKTIVVFPDPIDGEGAYTGNLSQYHMWDEFQYAKFLAPSDLQYSDLPPRLQHHGDEGSYYSRHD